MLKAGIFGATGYTGFELIKLLIRHPDVQICFLTSESNVGQTLGDLFSNAPFHPVSHLQLIASSAAPLDGVDVAFLCLPHGAAAQSATAALDAGVRVVDLSADFRISDPIIYRDWYGVQHPAPHLLGEAIYGLTERARAHLPSARLVANPGCYPTSVLLPLWPLLEAGAVAGTVIVDAKSGVSGAGRKPRQNTLFVEVDGNITPYAIGRSHRHLPEMEQIMSGMATKPPGLLFSPHLMPIPRGILSTIYVPLAEGLSGLYIRGLFEERFATEPFVHILPDGKLAEVAQATGTNHCVIGLTVSEDTLIITSVIDNLLKGAAGQAVQNMNVMFGCKETAGLLD